MLYKKAMKTDKRGLERKAFAKAGSYDVNTIEGGLESLEAEFLDISSAGACMMTKREHTPGSVIMLRFELGEAGVHIPCLAEVRWASREKDLYRVGVQFLS